MPGGRSRSLTPSSRTRTRSLTRIEITPIPCHSLDAYLGCFFYNHRFKRGRTLLLGALVIIFIIIIIVPFLRVNFCSKRSIYHAPNIAEGDERDYISTTYVGCGGEQGKKNLMKGNGDKWRVLGREISSWAQIFLGLLVVRGRGSVENKGGREESM